MVPAVAYVSAQLLCSEAELCELVVWLRRFAVGQGYRLRSTHVERLGRPLDAFQALVEQVCGESITTVLVPSLHHLAGLGPPSVVRECLEHFIEGAVVVTDYAP